MPLDLCINIGLDSGWVQSWSPGNLFAGGVQGAWFDPSDLTSMFQTTDTSAPAVVDSPVGRINDKSGNGNHATQGTAGSRPILRQAGALFYLEFDGVDDFLDTAGYAQTDGAGLWSCGASFYLNNLAGQYCLLDADDPAATNRLAQNLHVAITTGQPYTIAFNTTVGTFTDTAANVAATTPTVLTAVNSAGAVEIFKNNVGNGSVATSGTLVTAASRLRMGRALFDGLQPLAGRIYGAIQLARAFTASERANVQTFLAAKST